ncbi:MAG: NAD-dependent epimerase/dehydratase family protein [Ferrovibrio sp.]|uniref:NAD-dependent epimerase/dehydratase family protein n=1 Tax=Ferrovibrio sp. TaxID=1917215 RepID=UPI00391B4030
MKIDLTGKRVALIGGAGFIGHNLALALTRLGADVHIIDSLQVNNMGAFSNASGDSNKALYLKLIDERLALLREARVPLHIVDARDYHMLSRALSDINPNVVVQLAAIAHANRANKDPFSTFDHSFRTLENALDFCRSEGRHFVYFSSSMVYGNFDGEAVTEDRRCEPIGIYGALKYGGEKLVIAYNQVFGMPYTIVRPSALYGERCVSRRVGQAFIENALRGIPLTVNGDGSDALDFTYIEDLVQGLILSIAKPEAKNEIFNLTYGGGRTLKQMIAIVEQEFPGVTVKYNPRDALMPERGTLSIEKAKRLLGYQPNFPLEKGFVKYIRWYKDLAEKNPQLFVPHN